MSSFYARGGYLFVYAHVPSRFIALTSTLVTIVGMHTHPSRASSPQKVRLTAVCVFFHACLYAYVVFLRTCTLLHPNFSPPPSLTSPPFIVTIVGMIQGCPTRVRRTPNDARISSASVRSRPHPTRRPTPTAAPHSAHHASHSIVASICISAFSLHFDER